MARPKNPDTEVPLDEWADEHPLFPVEEGARPPRVKYIHVTRFEAGGQVYAERIFGADDLTDVGAIAQLFGGGHYELIGRRESPKDPARPGTITARRRYHVGGKSLPITTLHGNEEDDRSTGPVAPPSSSGMGDSVLIAILQMNQASQERAESRAERQAEADATRGREFMQLMMQMMNSGRGEAQAMTQLMLQMSQQQQASMMQMVTTMLATRGGGPEEFAKYAELVKALSGKDGEDGQGIEKTLNDVADIVTGLPTMLDKLKMGPGGVAIPQIENAPPGSAASVLANGGQKG